MDTIKLSYLVNALGKGLNEEKYKNMIVTYIGDSNDRAMLVLNTFRKAIIEDSLIAISLMGIILAKNIEANSNPSQDDLIIYKALENATDFDLKIFRKLISRKKNKK